MELFRFLFKEAPEKTQYILIMSVIAGMSEVASVLLTINGAQDVAAGRNYLLYAILLPTAAAVFILSKRISQTQTAALTEGVLEKLYVAVADDIRHAELPEIEKRDTSEIRMRMLNAQTVTDAAAKGVHAFQSLISLFFLWLYVFHISPPAGLGGLLITLFAVAVYEVIQTQMRSLAHEEDEKEGELAELFDHILYGAKEIRISQEKNGDMFVNRLTPLIRSIRETRIRTQSYFSGYWTFVNACFFTGMGSVAFLFSRIYSGETALEILIIAIYVWTPVLTIVGTLPDIENGRSAMDGLRRLARAEGDIRESVRHVRDPSEVPAKNFAELKLENVGFVYEGGDGESGFSVGPVSLAVRTGETLIVAGGNGSGKTTLMKILTGLYQPSSGMIRLDGSPADMTRYRHLFSTVFSDFHLFDALYGSDAPDDETVQELLRQTDLHRKTRWIADEKCFDRIRLSAGQMKRLALVVSLLEDKPVYVFDEWTADQDPHFRKYFYETLLPSLRDRGKMIIAVSHDDRYFHTADHLIRMEYGRVVSQTDGGFSAPLNDVCGQEEGTKRTGTDPVHEIFGKKQEYRHSFPKQFPPESEHGRKAGMGKRDRIAELSDLPGRKEIRRLIFNCILSAMAAPILIGIMFTVSGLHHGHSEWRLFCMFTITLVLYLVSFQRFVNTLTGLTEERIADIRLEVMDRVRQTDLYSFEKAGIERIHTALTYDMKSVSEVSHAVALSVRSVFTFTGFLFFMATLSLSAFSLTALIVALGVSLIVWNQLLIRQIAYSVRDREKKLLTAVTDMTGGFKELRLDSGKSDDFFHSSFMRHASRLRELKLRNAGLFADNCTLVFGLWQSLFLLVVLVLPFVGLFSESTLMTFVGVVVCLPAIQFMTTVPRVTLSSISMQRLHELGEELMHLGEEGAEPADETDLSEFAEIRYENLSFEYEEEGDRPFSVGPLNLSFRAGEIVFIVGGNGSGKSTLMKMLTGLYPVRSGAVFLNGEDIGAARCRSLFSAIFYNFHLFDQLYGLENIDADRVNDLLRLMQLEEKVQFDGDRFSTLDLSTGQRKRLAMVAAMMEDKPICMFDEWAADQDPQFRKYFYETLLPSFKAQGKTVIAVSHDDRYFHVADRVVKLEYGQIAAEPDSADI